MGIWAACLLAFLSVTLPVFAGSITGQIQTATGGAVAMASPRFSRAPRRPAPGCRLGPDDQTWRCLSSLLQVGDATLSGEFKDSAEVPPEPDINFR
jgi:hypothetical protein